GQLLLIKLRKGSFPEELLPVVEASIAANPDMGVRVQAMNYFESSSKEVRLAVGDIVGLEGDASRGKLTFSKNCSSCHMIKSAGGVAGPDLTEIKHKFD